MEDKTILYSVRYPSAQEEGERIKVRGDRQAAEAKLTEFLRRMREERTYEPIPGREEKGRRFAALARELSQIYEVGLDILRTPDSIEAALHLYCSAYSRDMTRRLAELLGMSVPPAGPERSPVILPSPSCCTPTAVMCPAG